MKDQLTAVLVAVRGVQGDLAECLRDGERNPRGTIEKIMQWLASKEFVDATAILSPSTVPSTDPDPIREQRAGAGHGRWRPLALVTGAPSGEG
jgi:hypothetical protein